jgi:hypothetical protein
LSFLANGAENMQIKVNDRTVEIFSGACVRDVLRKYSRITWKQIQKGSKAVFDRHGHDIALGGELSEGARLLVKRVGRPEHRS